MQYEVELKFPLTDRVAILAILEHLGAVPGELQVQVDQYFAHPVRSFAETDEALRIRSIGDQNRLTYKGPVVDRATKTRHESELNFQCGPDAAEQLAEIWQKLGFSRVRTVKKTRQTYHLRSHQRDLEICLDDVEGLGAFLEIETLAGPEDKSAAQQAILQLAQEFQLPHPERRSYLEMLIAKELRS